MPRPPRVEQPGAIFHVTQRSTDHELLFVDATDRRVFVHLLVAAARRYSWQLHDYCLLSTHYHLLVQPLEPTLARGMQYLNSRHVTLRNAAHGRRGALVHGRYYAGRVETEEHYLQVRGYLALNPVAAGLCATPAEWPWSGFGGRGAVSPTPDDRLRAFVRDYGARRTRAAAMAAADTSGH